MRLDDGSDLLFANIAELEFFFEKFHERRRDLHSFVENRDELLPEIKTEIVGRVPHESVQVLPHLVLGLFDLLDDAIALLDLLRKRHHEVDDLEMQTPDVLFAIERIFLDRLADRFVVTL
jgi:hypothetical protein